MAYTSVKLVEFIRKIIGGSAYSSDWLNMGYKVHAKAIDAPTPQVVVADVTLAEINAGKVIALCPKGRALRLLDASLIAIGDDAGSADSIDILVGESKVVVIAIAGLTEDTLVPIDNVNVTLLAGGASFDAGAEGEDISIGKTGSDVTDITSIKVMLTYLIEDPAIL